MRSLRTEFVRSSLAWAAAPLALWWVLLPFYRSEMWLGSWPEASAYAVAPTSDAAIVLGALMALDAARRRRNAPTSALRMSRQGWLGSAFQLGAGLIWAFVPLVVGLVAVAVRNVGPAPSGGLWPSYIAYAVAVLVAALCAAHLIGFAMPSVPIAALAGAAVGFVASAYAEIPLSAPPQVELNAVRLVLAWAVALVAIVAATVLPARIVAASRSRQAGSWRAAAAVVAAATVGATVAAPAVGEIQVSRPMPSHPACTTEAPVVCVWPEHAGFLPSLTPIAARAAQAAQGVLPVPDRFIEDGAAPAPTSGATFTWLTPGAGIWQAAEGMVNIMLNIDVTEQACLPTKDVDWAHLRALTSNLQYWLTVKTYGRDRPSGYAGQSDDVSDAIRALTLDDDAQRAWAKDVVAQMRAVPCQPVTSGK